LRAGAFLLLWLFHFEKRNKSPVSTWIRNERGREDKPLTSVLYSTREGGDLMEQSSSDKKTIQHQYDALAKKTLKGEAKNFQIELAKRAAREVSFSELSESELNQFYVLDEYESDFYRFQVSGYDVFVRNALLGEALETLSERKRNIVLLSYFLDMSDEEIGQLLNVVRTTVFRHRKAALAKIKQYMEGKADENK